MGFTVKPHKTVFVHLKNDLIQQKYVKSKFYLLK